MVYISSTIGLLLEDSMTEGDPEHLTGQWDDATRHRQDVDEDHPHQRREYQYAGADHLKGGNMFCDMCFYEEFIQSWHSVTIYIQVDFLIPKL